MPEGIATNILSERLLKLESAGILKKKTDPVDGRKRIYTLTQRGLALVPLLLELMIWSRDHTSEVDISRAMVSKIKKDRAAAVEEVLSRLR